MNSHTRKLLTIITEAAIENRLLKDLDRLGAHGYTVSDARGRGSRGARDSAWDTSSNIRIEVVCDDQTARSIAAHVQAHYYDDYGMILFAVEVDVLRPSKF